MTDWVFQIFVVAALLYIGSVCYDLARKVDAVDRKTRWPYT